MADGAVWRAHGRRVRLDRMFGWIVTERFLGARVVVRESVEQLCRKWREDQQHDSCRHEGEAEAPKDYAHQTQSTPPAISLQLRGSVSGGTGHGLLNLGEPFRQFDVDAPRIGKKMRW